jgi:hypothetical protein
MLSRRAIAAIAALLAIAAAAVVFVATDSDPSPARDAPGGYRVVYRIEDRTENPARISTEVVEVARPLRSRRSIRPGAPPGGATTGGSITTEDGVYAVGTDNTVQQVAVVLPGEPGSDLRLTTSLASAARRSLARRDGTGTVLGRECDWWVTRGPLDTDSPSPATAGDRVRSCVDAVGLLLEDDWISADRPLRHRVAVELDPAPDLSGTEIFAGVSPKAIPDRIRSTVVAAGQRPDWLVPPSGLRELRVARGTDFDPSDLPPQAQRITDRTVFASEHDFAVVDVVEDLLAAPALGTGAELRLGRNGSARLRPTPAGLVVELLGGQRLIRVRTSLSEDVLVAWLSGLSIGTR